MSKLHSRKSVILIISLFLIAFLWQLFLTAGFDFFWEDFDVFSLYQFKQTASGIIPERPSLSDAFSIGIHFLQDFFRPERLFHIGFNSWSYTDRPYQFLTDQLLRTFFCDTVILYRITKAIVFGINTVFIFLLVSFVSRPLGIIACILYMTTSEIWLSSFYLTDPGPFAQCAVIIAVFFFIKLCAQKKESIHSVVKFYIPIILLSNYAVLSKTDGRYLAVIFFLTLVSCRRAELRYHLIMLGVLLLLEIPVLGFIIKPFMKNGFFPIDIKTHIASNSLKESFFSMIKNYKFILRALGQIPLVVLFLSISIISCYVAYKKWFKRGALGALISNVLWERLILFSGWFFSTFMMIVYARGFLYNGKFSLQLLDLACFIAPFIIMMSYFIYVASQCLHVYLRKSFITVCLLLLLVQVICFNGKRLNIFRGAWGDYFGSWQNTQEYIRKNSRDGLVLAFTKNHYKPFLLLSTPHLVENTQEADDQSDFSNFDFIQNKFKNTFYNDIFVVSMDKLVFRGNPQKVQLIATDTIDGNLYTFYDRIRSVLLKREYKSRVYVYHFKRPL